jgi:hypothetical protein
MKPISAKRATALQQLILKVEQSEEDKKEFEKCALEVKNAYLKLLITSDLINCSAITSDLSMPAKKADDKSTRTFHVETELNRAADLLDRGIDDRAEWQALREGLVKAQLELLSFFCERDVRKKEAEDACGGAIAKPCHPISYPSKLALVEKEGAEAYSKEITQVRDNLDFTISGVPQPAAEVKAKVHEARAAFNIANAKSIIASGIEENESFILANRIRRRSADDKIGLLKALASLVESGPLNLESRMSPIRKRFAADFSDAAQSMLLAAAGLNNLFEYDDPLPNAIVDGTENADYFDDCNNWVRRAIAFILESKSLDQTLDLPISVKRLIDADWKEQLNVGVLDFEVSKQKIPLLSNWIQIRAAGISAYVSGDASKDIWPILFEFPKTASIDYLSGNTGTLDQSHFSECLLGLVSGFDARMSPVVYGNPSHRNASPLGRVKLEIPKSAMFGTPCSSIEDIMIVLRLVAKRK